MNDINRNLPPPTQAGRAEPLDLALVEHYLACSRKTAQVTIDCTHLAQLCNEVWRRRREEREARETGVSAAANVQEHSNRLATSATKAIADVAFTGKAKSWDATAIVQVANMLAELMEWRSGVRSNPRTDHISRGVGDGLVVHGRPEAMDRLQKMQDELESARRIVQELERMGWLMKAKS